MRRDGTRSSAGKGAGRRLRPRARISARIIISGAVCGLIALVPTLAVRKYAPYWESKFFDVMFHFPQGRGWNQDILMIDLFDPEQEKEGETCKLYRCEDLTRTLKILTELGVGVIALDKRVDENGFCMDDEEMLDLIKKNENIIVPMTLGPEKRTGKVLLSEDGAEAEAESCQWDRESCPMMLPIESLGVSNKRFGFANMYTDPDHVVRRVPVWRKVYRTDEEKTQNYRPLALRAFEAHLNGKTQGLPGGLRELLATDAEKFLPIYFVPYTPTSVLCLHVPEIMEILEDNIRMQIEPLPAARRGSMIALVGAVSQCSGEDRHLTPLSRRGGEMDGLQLQAQILNTLMSGYVIRPLEVPWVVILLMGWGIVCFWAGSVRRNWLSVVMLLILVNAAWIAAFWVFGKTLVQMPVYGLWAGLLLAAFGGFRNRVKVVFLREEGDGGWEASVSDDKARELLRKEHPGFLALDLGAVLNEHLPHLKLLKFLNHYETLFRYLAVIAVMEIVEMKERTEISTAYLHDRTTTNFNRPSLGNWMAVLRTSLSAVPPESAGDLFMPELYAAFRSPKGKTLNQMNRRLEKLGEILKLRDSTKSRAGFFGDEQSHELLEKFMPLIQDFEFGTLSFLRRYPLICVRDATPESDEYWVEVWIGVMPYLERIKSDTLLIKGRVYLFDPDRRRVLPLHPLLVRAVCREHHQAEFFIYNKGLLEDGKVAYNGFDAACGYEISADDDSIQEIRKILKA